MPPPTPDLAPPDRPAATRPDAASAVRVLEPDRLGRFLPALIVLTVTAAILEGAAAVVLGEAALAFAAASTSLFAIAVVIAAHQVRIGRPFRARAALAMSLVALGAAGAATIPDVGHATALLPVVSAVLVLPHVPRQRLPPLVIATVGSAVGILTLGETIHLLPAIAEPAATLFFDGMLVGVLLLVLAGLADFAMDARESLRNLQDATARQLQITTSRLSIAAALRLLQVQPTPEETADTISAALTGLTFIDFAGVTEATESGLFILATAGATFPILAGDRVPAARAKRLLDRSRQGAWAEVWPTGRTGRPDRSGADDSGIRGQAFAPILAGDEIVGLVSIGTRDPDQAARLLSDLPFISEAAAVAGTILAPALLARRQMAGAKVRIAEIIASGAFHPVFQPIVDLSTGVTVGYEALTRFAAGDPAESVFADAERAGLGAELEAATLTAAVRDGARLPPDAWLSLNVSPRFLAECGRLTGILAHRTRPIVLEITEHEIIDDYLPLHAAMATLGADVRLAVDDAGAGVANFRHLVDLRPHLVKIDAALIRGANADISRQALIVGMVHFAAVSGALVLAEGIETEAEQATVERLGVSLGQGYHLARPAPIEAWTLARPAAHPRDTTGKVVPIRKAMRTAHRPRHVS
jgi:EAL domain-containing protein (putative c-di-GMP-specific phosphodiesterase class I)